ncbi:MAG: tRNA (guanine37-N1)-methyltransferase [Desulforhopalus sp.]|jgi:tRNA (guanine37-N1)-methyltransferase
MIFDILTIFPEILDSPLQEGIIRRALEKNQIEVNIINIRDFATGPHSMTDDRPFGGGEGMVMKPEPLAEAVQFRQNDKKLKSRVIFLSPQGKTYNQSLAKELANEDHLILVCGRYEGVDERFITEYVDDEISLGDFILTGGELGAMVMVDSITRLVPGVLGCQDSVEKDTFSRSLLKHAQYTRPRSFDSVDVPEELLSGNHQKIEEFRFIDSVLRTLKKRPDLIKNETFSSKERKLLKLNGLLNQVEKVQKTGNN